MKKFINGFLVAILLFSIAVSPASASGQVADGVVSLEDVRQFGSEMGLTEKEILKEYEDYLSIKDYFEVKPDGTLYFNAEEAISNGVEKELVEYNDYMVNEQLAGELASCKGIKGKYSDGALIDEAYFDNCQTNTFVRILQAGGAISLIISAMSAFLGFPLVALVTTYAAVVMLYTAFELSNVDKGCGIVVSKPIWSKGSVTGQSC